MRGSVFAFNCSWSHTESPMQPAANKIVGGQIHPSNLLMPNTFADRTICAVNRFLPGHDSMPRPLSGIDLLPRAHRDPIACSPRAAQLGHRVRHRACAWRAARHGPPVDTQSASNVAKEVGVSRRADYEGIAHRRVLPLADLTRAG